MTRRFESRYAVAMYPTAVNAPIEETNADETWWTSVHADNERIAPIKRTVKAAQTPAQPLEAASDSRRAGCAGAWSMPYYNSRIGSPLDYKGPGRAFRNRHGMERIGLIGVGAMGEPMGATLLRKGFAVCVCSHRTRDRVERLVTAGASEAKDPASVAEVSDVVITMVPDSPQVEEALFGPRGAVRGMKRGGRVIDMSTISPVASRDFNARLSELGISMVDAPVSGGPARAATGELTIMAGGEKAAFNACEPILRALGTPTYVGGPGMGETVKLVNQIIIATVMIANVEGLIFAKKAGADISAVRSILATATANNYLLEKWLPQTWFAGKLSGGFALDLLRKDLNAALDAARQMGLGLPASGLTYQLFTAASGSGHGREDYSAVSALYEDLAGVRVTEGMS